MDFCKETIFVIVINKKVLLKPISNNTNQKKRNIRFNWSNWKKLNGKKFFFYLKETHAWPQYHLMLRDDVADDASYLSGICLFTLAFNSPTMYSAGNTDAAAAGSRFKITNCVHVLFTNMSMAESAVTICRFCKKFDTLARFWNLFLVVLVVIRGVGVGGVCVSE